jgi:endonuclease III
VSEKFKKILQLQREVPLAWEVVDLPPEAKLLDVGLFCVLSRRLSAAQAEKVLKALSSAYPDWNELRISQVQEFLHLIPSKSEELSLAVARDVKTYLQEIFQKSHGFDLEFLREDPGEAGKFVSQLTFLGASAGHYLVWRAGGGNVPATAGIVRVLDRLGLVKRTSSMRKAQDVLNKLVPEDARREFSLRFGLVVERWCDPKKPICWECVLVEGCPHGRKARKDWLVQQKRFEEQRRREEERRAKEEEKLRKKAEQEAKRRAVEDAKRKAKEDRERKRIDAIKAREDARRKALAAREAAREKARLAKQKAAEKAAEKRGSKKPASKKPAASKKKGSPATKKKSGSRPSRSGRSRDRGRQR